MAIELLRPNSDVSVELTRSGGSYNYEMVDEDYPKDDDVTCNINTADTYKVDIYGFSNIASIMKGTITNVRVVSYCKCYLWWGATASIKIKNAVKPGSTVYYGSEITSSYLGYTKTVTDWATNPDGGDWTWDAIDNIAAGVAIRRYTGICDARVTQLFIEITYTLPSGESIRPTSDIVKELTPSSGSDNYAMVDEEVLSSADSNAIWQYNGEKKDIYGLSNHSTGSGTINYITVVANGQGGQLSVIGNGKLTPYIRVKTNGSWTEYAGTRKHMAQTGELYYSQSWTINPNTSAAWSWDDIDNLQAGWSLTGKGLVVEYVAVYQVYIIINYTPAAGNIKKINTVEWASVKKYIGVVKASIKKASGVSAA